MNHPLSFQIGIETATRCAGACEGCALDNDERTKQAPFEKERLRGQLLTAVECVRNELKKNGAEVEAITLFFGQGDHFLWSTDDLGRLTQTVQEVWPAEWGPKTVCLVTASAVTKPIYLRERADFLKQKGDKTCCQWFVQVVFDPKRFTREDAFSKQYLDNILYLKRVFSMVELTINLAGDMTRQMTPEDLHAWVVEHKFKHVEFNWVVRPEMKEMWRTEMRSVWAWLKTFTSIAWKEKQYELNFMPWTIKRLKETDRAFELGERAFYINQNVGVIASQVGPIGNVAFLQDRASLVVEEEQRMHIRAHRAFTKGACSNCSYARVCQTGGVYPWTQWLDGVYEQDCPWGLSQWYDHVLATTKGSGGKTIFDKNPTNKENVAMGQADAFYFHQQQVEG
jgi:hypothetical protein